MQTILLYFLFLSYDILENIHVMSRRSFAGNSQVRILCQNYESLQFPAKNRTLVFPRLFCKCLFQKHHASYQSPVLLKQVTSQRLLKTSHRSIETHCQRFQCSTMNIQRVIQEKQQVQFFAGSCSKTTFSKSFFFSLKKQANTYPP